MHATQRISTFDRTEHIVARISRPERYRDLYEIIAKQDAVIARGAGLSCSAASFGQHTTSLDITRFNRILGYDEASGVLSVEPGVSVGSLVRLLAAKKRCLPCVPGYPAITIGGCVAFDVHGKNQYIAGNFGSWIEELAVFHRDHGEIVCNRNQNSEVFDLTIGGMGLTGVITRVLLRTAPLPGSSVRIVHLPAHNLRHAAELMLIHSDDALGMYSWNDLNLTGKKFGRGMVCLEYAAEDSTLRSEQQGRLALDTRLPFNAWNYATTRVALSIYRCKQLAKATTIASVYDATFPIKGKELYYAAFGRAGFREYQLIVPMESWDSFVTSLQKLISSSATPITLGSLKLFRGVSEMLRFCGTGMCLAINVPAIPRSLSLFAELDRLAINSGAILNVSKDSRITKDICAVLFPGYSTFRRELRRFDPNERYQSHLRVSIDV